MAQSTALSTADQIEAITRHSAGLAAAARVDLAAPVEHCPGWTVADLVAHVTDVHWFWATIAEERLSAPPEESRRPPRAADAELIPTFQAGAARLAAVLGGAKQKATCWTWAPDQQNIAFITRHQVQEAAVHHWDAAHAADRPWVIAPEVAADAVDEFLEVSCDGELGGVFTLQSGDTGDTWTLSDTARGLTVAHGRDGAEPPKLRGSSAGLLLWLYRRIDLAFDAPPELVTRFRTLCQAD